MTKKQAKLTSFFKAAPAASPSAKHKKEVEDEEEPPAESPPADSPESEPSSPPPIPLHTQLRRLAVDSDDPNDRGRNAKYLYGFLTAWDALSLTFAVDWMDSADINHKVRTDTGLTLHQVMKMQEMNSIIGSYVRKDFDEGPFEGIVVDVGVDDEDGSTFYTVVYQDDDCEDMNEEDFQACREYYNQFHQKKKSPSATRKTKASKSKGPASNSNGKRRRKLIRYAESEEDSEDDEYYFNKKPPAKKKKRAVKKSLFRDDEEDDFKPLDSSDDEDDHGGGGDNDFDADMGDGGGGGGGGGGGDNHDDDMSEGDDGDGQYSHYDNEFHKKLRKDLEGFSAKSNPQAVPARPYVDPVGVDPTHGIVEGIVNAQVRKVASLLNKVAFHSVPGSPGELTYPIRLQTACSGTDAPSIALGLVKESLDRMMVDNHTFDYSHEMSCEIEPFKQAYIGRNFPGVPLFPDITKLTASEEVLDVYGRPQTLPDGNLFVAGTSCKDFSMLKTRYRLDIEDKGTSGQTFLAAVEFLQTKQPTVAIFENVMNAPWHKMQEYITGRLELRNRNDTKGITGGKNTGKAENVLKFSINENGCYVAEEVPRQVGIRAGEIVQGFVRSGDNAAHVRPLVADPTQARSLITLGALARKHSIDLKKDILVMEKEVQYCTHLVKVDTKDFGLPQTRQRQYLFIWKSNDPDDKLGGYFQLILEHLKTPLLHSMDAFLLPDTHDRIRCFREALRSGPGLMVKRERAKEPDFWDWNLSRVKDLTLHIAYRMNTGIEERSRFLTGWDTRGRKQLAPGLWPELFDCWNHRRLDMVDCFGCSAVHDGVSRDPLHHSFTWDVSQNVTRAPYRNATVGVSGCITPGGELLLPHRGRTIMGYEKLLLQGIPFSRLLLGPESEVQLSDLAGNAMSVPVVCAVQLAAICAPHLRRDHLSSKKHQVNPSKKTKTDEKELLSSEEKNECNNLLTGYTLNDMYDHAGGSVLAERGDLFNMPRDDSVQNLLSFLGDEQLASDAYLSSVLCTCESSGTMTKSPAILLCLNCGHSVCHICSSRYNLSSHILEPLSLPEGRAERPDPHVFERMLRCAIPSVLRLGPNWEGVLKNGEGLGSYSFQLQEVQRKKGHWQLIYGAWEDHGQGRQVAEIRICIGQTYTLSNQRGSSVFIRRFAPAIRHRNPYRGPLKDSARLILTPDSEPHWEIREPWNSKTKKAVFLKLVGLDVVPSQRVLAGINDTAATRLRNYNVRNADSLPNSRNPVTHYHSKWKTWPGTIVVSGDPRVSGTYRKMKCTHTVVLSALWRRDDSAMYLFYRPDVLRTTLDVAVFSPSPSYNDGLEICELVDWIPENTLEERRQTTEARFLEWRQAPSGMAIGAMQPRMDLQPSPSSFHERVTPEEGSAVLCELSSLPPQTVEALLEYSGPLKGNASVPLDLFGKSGTRNAKRLSIVVAPSLLKYAAEGRLPLTLSEWYRLSDSTCFGSCTANVPTRPVEHWRSRADGDGKPERVYDPQESNEYYQRLFSRPNGFTVSVDRANNGLVIKMDPHVAAHRAAAQLGGRAADSVRVDYCLAELSSMGEPPTQPFHVPNSDAYYPAEIDGLLLPLYTRQAKALTRMQSIEGRKVPFSEEERSEIVLPGVGWCLMARASKTSPLRGGVLGDAIGSGKTVVTIALILSGVERARANRNVEKGRSGATLIVVPPGLIRQWDDEREKFTGNALNCIIVDSTAKLKRYSVEDLCKADIVLVPAGLIEEESGKRRPYTELLARKAGTGAVPPAPANYSQREAPTIEGTWVRNMASGPEIYVGNKGKQKHRDEQAYYGHCYAQAIEELRTKKFAADEKGVPIEYFTWERLVVDECHESLVTGRSQESDDDRFKPKARRGAREFLGVSVTSIDKRPLRAATGVWGLTGTPLLETEARVTELANLMGGTYLTGAAHHWRKEERESGRDLFLNQQGASRSREYRCAVHAACHSYVKEACQRNRGEKLNVELTRVLSEVRMSRDEAQTFFKMTSDLASQSFALTPDQLGEKAGDVLSLTAASQSRRTALLETIDSILQVDPTTKIVVFSNTSYGGYRSAAAALSESGRPFCLVQDNDSVEAQNETLSWFRHLDVTDEERARPRVLLLSFEQAAGHNLQEACHNVILYDPFYSGSDAVADASVEEQAVGRVMRQGQKYDVTVTRIVVRGPEGERCLDDWIVDRNLDQDVLDAATSNFD